MKTEHKYAQALRWIADGENLQIRWGKDPRWMELPERNEIVMDEILRGVGAYEFRIKPHTVKIGNREVEAPVLEPVPGHTVYWMHLDGVQKKRFHTCDPKDLWRAKHGRLFASHDAAEAMHAALTELLTGSAA